MAAATTPRRDVLPICLDGRLLSGATTGVATYARGLVDALGLIDRDRFVLRESQSSWPTIASWAAILGGRTRVTRRGADIEPGYSQLVGRRLFRAAHEHFSLTGRIMQVITAVPRGIMHWTYPVPMRMVGWHNVYTVHDVIPLELPDLVTVRAGRLAATLTAIMPWAERIITVSEDSRRRIVARLGCPADRVINCYQSVRRPEPTVPLPANLRQGTYFLYCGSNEKRKNLDRLVEAHRRSGAPSLLVLVGSDHARKANTPSRDSQAGVVRIPHLERGALESLICGARAVLFPSLAEGFGLPVIEAMAAGVPTLTSDFGALAEVAGNASLLVDPHDVDAIATGIAALDGDGALRARLCELGQKQAVYFGTERFASRLRGVYDSLELSHPL